LKPNQAKRGIALPVLCDDPLVHIDDQRAPEVIKILQQALKKTDEQPTKPINQYSKLKPILQ